ncbi:MAG TPA: 16S rRNA (adenine(1518)-N(6)/adenine(1519)-N(6))-dimethyltransferase RsmA [Candidatus Binatia bacterium]|nr:16S rRNA (adenine(1518)-N(6)/adenine(1519)-N(6))-dimethyltransferase RsmA [Candidatus Binatia bacterium]
MAKSAKIGQNFLHDKNIAKKIIGVFLPQPGPLLEIGAGPGILSGLLLEQVAADRLTLVEIDPFLARRLQERFGDPVRILEKNILEIDLADLYGEQLKSSDSAGGGSDLSAPQGKVAVIGNLPYHISKALIDWFIAQRARIAAAVLMLQKDYIDKLLSAENHKKYNAQSVAFQTLFRARRCFNVPAGAFIPAPKIVSTVLAISPADSPLQDRGDEFYHFARLCFGERRKTLWNNLAPHFDKGRLSAAFAACGFSEQARAEQLPAQRFTACFTALAETGQGER